MTDFRPVISSDTPTSPHLSRLVWLGEQLLQVAEEMTCLAGEDAVLRDLTGAEFDAFRQAATSARTAGDDVLLIASAAHQRAVERDESGPA